MEKKEPCKKKSAKKEKAVKLPDKKLENVTGGGLNNVIPTDTHDISNDTKKKVQL